MLNARRSNSYLPGEQHRWAAFSTESEFHKRGRVSGFRYTVDHITESQGGSAKPNAVS